MTCSPSVLFVGVGAPWSGGAGYLVRQDMLLRALSRVTPDLHLAMFDMEPGSATPPFACDVTPLPSPRRLPEAHWRSLMNDVIASRPMGLRSIDCGVTRAAVSALHPERFDAVVAYRCDFAYMSGVLGHRNLILDIDDPEHLRRAEAARMIDDGNHHWQKRLELRRLRRFEQSTARHAKACFVCQRHDARAFAASSPLIVPNCVNVPAHCPPREVDGPSVLFVGKLDGAEQSPNVDAMRWFLRDVWPKLQRRIPACEFRIAGPIREDWKAEAQGVAGVRVLGFVADLHTTLAQSSLTVAPIRFGTGTRIKILESMAWGCPVVSTAKGCEGLDVADREHLLVAESAEDLAGACERLIRDAALARRIAGNAWRVVAQKYDRQRQQEALTSLFARLISGDRQAVREAA